MKPVHLLAIETGSAHLSVCLGRDGVSVFSLNWYLPMMHAQMLGIMVQKVLALANLDTTFLDGVVVGSGPGSYTGLRIGVSFAKGLCFGLKIPLLQVSAFENCDAQVRRRLPESKHILTVFDARRDEVFACMELPDSGSGILKGAYQLSDFDESLPRKFPNLILVGNGGDKVFQYYGRPENWSLFSSIEPDAKTTLSMGFEKWKLRDFVSPSLFEPDYIKPVYFSKPPVSG
jgi:tRNA threonylcarbamoyladenosine biosynthesis protein TsaB